MGVHFVEGQILYDLLNSQYLDNIIYLNLRSHTPFEYILKTIIKSTSLKNVKRFKMHHCEMPSNDILLELLNSEFVTQLERLDFDLMFLTQDMVRSIGASHSLRGLKRLGLQANSLTRKHTKYLLDSPNLINLEYLDISFNMLAKESMIDLITADSLQTVKTMKIEKSRSLRIRELINGLKYLSYEVHETTNTISIPELNKVLIYG